jgi:predicted phosphoribosyltransferase
MKCPACGQILKRIEGVCGEYICINTECLENKKARGQAYEEFYGLTQAEIYANYRIALAKK